MLEEHIVIKFGKLQICNPIYRIVRTASFLVIARDKKRCDLNWTEELHKKFFFRISLLCIYVTMAWNDVTISGVRLCIMVFHHFVLGAGLWIVYWPRNFSPTAMISFTMTSSWLCMCLQFKAKYLSFFSRTQLFWKCESINIHIPFERTKSIFPWKDFQEEKISNEIFYFFLLRFFLCKNTQCLVCHC